MLCGIENIEIYFYIYDYMIFSKDKKVIYWGKILGKLYIYILKIENELIICIIYRM